MLRWMVSSFQKIRNLNEEALILPSDARSNYTKRRKPSIGGIGPSSRLNSRNAITILIRCVVLFVILRIIWRRSSTYWISSSLETDQEIYEEITHPIDEFVKDGQINLEHEVDHQGIQKPIYGAILDTSGRIFETSPEQERYLFYLPNGGLSNQFISLMKAIGIAAVTNRTLIVPPIVRTSHEQIADSIKQYESWGKYFDFSTVGAKVLFYDPMYRVPSGVKVANVLPSRGERLFCHAVGPRASTMGMGTLARKFAGSSGWILADQTPEWEGEYKDMPKLTEFEDHFGAKEDAEQTVCITGTFFLVVPTWEAYARQLQFKGYVTSLAEQWVHSLTGRKEYLAVHWRRGDFKEHCNALTQSTIDFYKGAKCWPSIKEAVTLIETKRKVDDQNLPVVILTNTEDAKDREAFKDAGYAVIDHVADYMSGVVRELLGPVFGDSIIDSAIASSPQARVFIGNRYSTWSSLAALRAKDTKILYF